MDYINDDESEQYYELLALKSIYEADNDVLNLFTVKDGELTLNAGKINIQVELHSKDIVINVENEDGSSGTKKYVVEYLPPLTLNFVLKKEYPEKDEPSFNLTCKWLSRQQLTKICKQLDDIWQKQKGSEVLYDWVQFIQENTLKTTNLTCIVLNANNDKIDEDCLSVDNRTVQEVECFAEILPYMLEYNEQMLDTKFNKEVFDCKICYAEKYGKDCIRFKDCQHVYCKDCLLLYFRHHIKEGTVTSLLCPEEKCESQAFPAQIKSLVLEEEYEKYEKLLLTTTLDVMADVVYCPRQHCQSPVIVEPKETMGMCTNCTYAFCTFCKLAYHGVSQCKLKNEELKKVYEEYKNGDDIIKQELRKKYGARLLEQKLQELESEQWIYLNTKKCPNCSAPVQKNDGCNKMTCIKCRAYFCWLCMNTISIHNPYSHYNTLGGHCYQKLFQGAIPDDNFEVLFI